MTLSDAIDGTNAPKGAMFELTNLVPAPTTRGVWLPRSAQRAITTFAGITGAAQINALLGVGNVIYGMIATTSGAYSGKDQPFAYNVATNQFLVISIPQGAASLPATPSATGDWTPPIMAQVAERIMITHPGYAGSVSGYFFGWLDISSFTSNLLTGTIQSGSNQITLLSGNVEQDGWEIGMTVTGNGIPANTLLTAINVGALDLNTTAVLSFGTNLITNVGSLAGVVPGCAISGLGIPSGTLVQSLPGGNSVIMTQAATQAGTFTVNFSGAVSATMSNNATASASLVVLTVAGGTPTLPLYGAGNTNSNPLPSVPVSVAQFNGRAWFACDGNGVVFSDALNPCQVTNASQALTSPNGLPYTALAALPLSALLTGGINQSLIVFQGDGNMIQITGDQATSNLSQNSLGVGIGTLAPNTLCNTPQGLAFIASDGLRIISYLAQVSDPIGKYGEGVWNPFVNAINPTRMCASYNQDVIRISVQNGTVTGQPVQEYWYHMSIKAWSGPHTGAAALLQPYQGTTNGFVAVMHGVNAQLFLGTPIPTPNDTYTENGIALNWAFATVLLPDNDDGSMNSEVETAIAIKLGNSQTVQVTKTDEQGNILGTVAVTGSGQSVAQWGSSVWGQFIWGGGANYFYQVQIPWTQPLVFKQAMLTITGQSVAQMALGNIYMRIERTGYLLATPASNYSVQAIEGSTPQQVISAQ